MSNNIYYRVGEDWKRIKTAIGKQASPRNVQSYTSGFNGIINQFVKYIQSARDESGTIADCSLPLRKLLMESMCNYKKLMSDTVFFLIKVAKVIYLAKFLIVLI